MTNGQLSVYRHIDRLRFNLRSWGKDSSVLWKQTFTNRNSVHKHLRAANTDTWITSIMCSLGEDGRSGASLKTRAANYVAGLQEPRRERSSSHQRAHTPPVAASRGIQWLGRLSARCVDRPALAAAAEGGGGVEYRVRTRLRMGPLVHAKAASDMEAVCAATAAPGCSASCGRLWEIRGQVEKW